MIEGMHQQFAAAGLLIAVTLFVHAIFIALAALLFRNAHRENAGALRVIQDSFLLIVIGLWLMAAHTIEIWMWAQLFLELAIFDDPETSFYFAAVSYTTLGFGDILIDPPWRLLAGAAAADGLLLFGLSAAFLVEISVKLRLGGDR